MHAGCRELKPAAAPQRAEFQPGNLGDSEPRHDRHEAETAAYQRMRLVLTGPRRSLPNRLHRQGVGHDYTPATGHRNAAELHRPGRPLRLQKHLFAPRVLSVSALPSS